jgi:hypothetical protein
MACYGGWISGVDPCFSRPATGAGTFFSEKFSSGVKFRVAGEISFDCGVILIGRVAC